MHPKLSLQYSTGQGNGPFGLGWSLSVPMISRKTEKGIPKFDDRVDTFMLSGAEDLVPFLENGEHLVRTESQFGINWQIFRYRPRVEGLHARIEFWKPGPLAKRDLSAFWRITTRDNVTSIYGYSPQAKFSAPGRESKIFDWRLELTLNAKGNCVWYQYKSDSGLTEKWSKYTHL